MWSQSLGPRVSSSRWSVVVPSTFTGSYGVAGSAVQHVINQTGTGFFDNQSSGPGVYLSGGSSSNVIYEVRHRPKAS